MKITIKTLAEYAGVSIGTVSRALNNDPLIAKATRERIHRLASDLNYVPNFTGKALQSSKSYLIGYLLPNTYVSFYNEIIQGISSVTMSKRYGLLLGLTGEDTRAESEQLRIFQEKNVDGILVSTYCRENIRQLRSIQESGIPLVACDIRSFDPSVPEVIVNEEKAAELVVKHLSALKCEQSAYCFLKNENGKERFDLINILLAKKGKRPLLPCRDLDQLNVLMRSKKKPAAIICYSDMIAVEVIQALKKLKLTVPSDVSVIGFDDMFFAAWPELGITTIAQPKVSLGTLAAETLFRLIDTRKSARSIYIEPTLVERSSSRKV